MNFASWATLQAEVVQRGQSPRGQWRKVQRAHAAPLYPERFRQDGLLDDEVDIQTNLRFFAAGAEVHWDVIGGRDHLTLPADMAVSSDVARHAVLSFLRGHLAPQTPDGSVGLITMCCGGGLGTGTIIERR